MSSNNAQTSQPHEMLDVISEVAEQRRRNAQPVLDRRLPDWVLEVFQSDVIYTFNPRMLPIKQASFSIFMELLQERYGVKFKSPDLELL